jgi:hypothetical protein
MINKNCGCDNNNGPKLILKEGQQLNNISEGLKHHIQENRMLADNIYRPLSSNYSKLFCEARELYNKGLLLVTEGDAELLESNIGEYGMYKGMRVPLDYPILLEELIQLTETKELEEADKKKKTPPIGKPKRGGSKKFYVYVRKPGGGIKKVSFGDTTGLRAKINNPKARRAFAKRHKCGQGEPRTSAKYWSCRLPRIAKSLGLKTNYSGYW